MVSLQALQLPPLRVAQPIGVPDQRDRALCVVVTTGLVWALL